MDNLPHSISESAVLEELLGCQGWAALQALVAREHQKRVGDLRASLRKRDYPGAHEADAYTSALNFMMGLPEQRIKELREPKK